MKIRLGSRGSPLALKQAHMVSAALTAAFPHVEVEIFTFKTTGDKIQNIPLSRVGGKGLFTKEIEEALLADLVDIAVHSLKDMPAVLPDGLSLAAVLEREDPRDAFIAPFPFKEAPKGATFGTSSLRRQAQILSVYPEAQIVPLRGNVGTRLEKISQGEAQATVMAYAGLKRLEKEDVIQEVLPLDLFLPAAAQGIIAIEIRENDTDLFSLLQAINHRPTWTAMEAERAFLKALDGSCRIPIAAHAHITEDTLSFEGFLWREGARRVALQGSIHEAEKIGWEAGLALK